MIFEQIGAFIEFTVCLCDRWMKQFYFLQKLTRRQKMKLLIIRRYAIVFVDLLRKKLESARLANEKSKRAKNSAKAFLASDKLM